MTRREWRRSSRSPRAYGGLAQVLFPIGLEETMTDEQPDAADHPEPTADSRPPSEKAQEKEDEMEDSGEELPG